MIIKFAFKKSLESKQNPNAFGQLRQNVCIINCAPIRIYNGALKIKFYSSLTNTVSLTHVQITLAQNSIYMDILIKAAFICD